jgi:prepilin-type N-terminal cleavage/methylation domain-containing protein
MNQSLAFNHKGFTLIETLFAVLIFSSALVSLMTIAGRGIAAANSAREQTVAHYLAQEGLEVVRTMRDTNFTSTVWDNGFKDCTETDPCQINYQGGAGVPYVESCGGSFCPKVWQNNGAFVDSGNGGQESAYTRSVYVISRYPDTNNPNEYTEHEIVSKVFWNAKGVMRSVMVQTILKKWQ